MVYYEEIMKNMCNQINMGWNGRKGLVSFDVLTNISFAEIAKELRCVLSI